MKALKDKLKPDGSVLIVIRPHLREGQLSDYVLKTRLAVRKDGWKECEELIWYKPDGPPLGSIRRPRRAWESILWFSMTARPYVDLLACGNANSRRTGGFDGSRRFEGTVIADNQHRSLHRGTSRITDVLTAYVGTLPQGVMHPAMYPTELTDVLVQTFSRPGDLILDPFAGSGQTLLSALRLSRTYIGIDCEPKYVELASKRLEVATLALSDRSGGPSLPTPSPTPTSISA